MAYKVPAEQGELALPIMRMSRLNAARMLLDLIHQTMVAAPPRTWVQSVHHPGSRRWLVSAMSATSDVLGRPLPAPAGDMRRPAVIAALEALLARTEAAGRWSLATQQERERLADLTASPAAHFPLTLTKIARSGALPFTPQEVARVRRRAHPIS